MPFELGVAAAAGAYVALAVVPGLAALRLAGLRPRDGLVGLGLATGLGLCLPPLLHLWLSPLGAAVRPWFWWALVAGSAVALIAAAERDLRRRGPVRFSRAALATGDRAPTWAVAGIVAAVVVSRWWAAHDLTVPLWGDSLHHTIIARLFVVTGGLPASWEPIVPLATFTYHFGLHAGVAALAGMTGLPEHTALLVSGQALSVLQVLTAYALAAGVTGRRWAGVFAALAAAGLSPMPAYYLNWGRYTQLAGQVILPVAALAVTWAMRADREAWAGRRGSVAAVAALLAAGLLLTHYLVTLFLVAYVAAWLGVGFVGLVAEGRGGPRRVGAAARASLGVVARAGVVALAALALTAPWLARLADSVLARAAARMVSGGLADPDVYGVVAPQVVWGSLERLDANVGLGLVAAAACAVAYGLWRRDRYTAVGAAWAVLLVASAYPGALGLSMTPPLKDFTVAIGLYVPLGLAIGAAVGGAVARVGLEAVGAAPGRRAWALAAAVVLAALGLAWKDGDVVDAAHVLVTPEDERAMAWIREATPASAVFLVGCVEAFGDTVCAGDDAGWWITVLTGRGSTVPPVTYGIERSSDPTFSARTNALADLWRADLDAGSTRAALQEAGVTHAYVGVTGRALPRERLEASRHWRRVYGTDGARVYAFLPEGGAGP